VRWQLWSSFIFNLRHPAARGADMKTPMTTSQQESKREAIEYLLYLAALLLVIGTLILR
jgi:hypothetical protein